MKTSSSIYCENINQVTITNTVFDRDYSETYTSNIHFDNSDYLVV